MDVTAKEIALDRINGNSILSVINTTQLGYDIIGYKYDLVASNI